MFGTDARNFPENKRQKIRNPLSKLNRKIKEQKKKIIERKITENKIGGN